MDNYSNRDSSGSSRATIASCCRLIGPDTTASSPVSWLGRRKKCAAAATAARALPVSHKVSRPVLTSKLIVPLAVATLLLHLIAVISLALSVSVQREQSAAYSLTLRGPSSDANSLPITHAKFGTHLAPLRRLVSLPHAWIGTRGPSRGELGAGHRHRHRRRSRGSLSLPVAAKPEDERSISEQTHGQPPIEIATGTSGQLRVQVINSRREFTSSSLTSEAPSSTFGNADVSSDAYAPRRRARGGSEQSILIRSRRNHQQQQQQQRPNKQRLGDGSQVSSSKQQHLVEQMFRNKLIDLTQKYMTNRAIGDRAYYVLLVIYALLITFGTISNLLICLTVILKPKILSPRNIFIVNLAGSDLLLCVFTMPFSFIEISMKMWQMGLIPCKLVAGLQATSIFVSTISITAIALDRYKVIVYPTHHETASGTRYAALLLASVWFGALLLSMPLFWFRTVEHYGEIVHSSVPFALPTGQQAGASSPLSSSTPSAPLASNLSGATLNAATMSELPLPLPPPPLPPPPALYANDNYQANSSGAQNSGADTTWMQQQQQQQSLTDAASEAAARAEDTSRAKFTDSIEFCIEAWPFDHGRGIYSVISMIFQYVLPITIVSVVYTKISHKLQKRLLRRQRLTQLAAQQKRQLNLIRRTHTMLVSVSLVFGLSWLPLNLLNVISDFSPGFRKLYDDQSFRVVFAVCHLIGCSSACSNPILYGFLNENFRKEFRQVYEYYGRMLARLVRRLLYSCYHCWLWCLCCRACCPPDNKPGGGDATTSASGTTGLGSTSNKLQSSSNDSYSPAAQRLKSALYPPDDQLVVHVDELSRSDFDSGQSVTTSGSRSYDDEDDDYYDDEDYYEDYDDDYYGNSTGSNLSGSSLDRSSTTWTDRSGKTNDRHRRRRLNEPSGAQISGSLMNLAVVSAPCNKRICSHSMRSLHQPNEQQQQQAALGASTNSSTKCERLASGEQQLLTTAAAAVVVKADGNGGGQMPSASSCNCIQAQQTDSVDGSRKLSSQTATSFSRHTMGRTMRLCLCISDSSSLESIDLGARAVTVSPDGLVSIRMNDIAKTNGRELQDASAICRGDNIGHGDDDEQRRQRRRVERLRRYRRRAIERAAAAAAAEATSSGHQRHELVQLKCECKCHSEEQAAPKLRATKVEVDSGGQQAEVVVVSGRAVESGGEQIGFAGHSKQQLITKQAENNKTTQVELNNDVPPPPTGTGRRVWLRFLGARTAPEVKSNRPLAAPTEAVQVSGQVVTTTSASNSSSSAAHSHSKPPPCSPPAPDLAQATLEPTEAEARASRQGDRFIVSKSEQVTYEIRASETNNEANNGTTIRQEKSGQQLKGLGANCSQIGQDCAVERRPLAARQCLNCKHSSGSGAAGSGPLSIVINGVDGGAPKSRDEQMRQMRRRRRRWRRRQQQQQRRLHQQAAHGLLVGHGHGGKQQLTDRVASGSLGVAGATGATGVPGTLRRKSNARTSGGGETKLRTRRYRLANWVSFNCLRGAGFQRGPVLARTRGTSKRGSWMKMSQRLRRAWPTYGRTCSSLDNQDKIDNPGGGGGGINIGAERGPANRLFGPLRRTFTMSYSSTAAPQLSGECSSVARQKNQQPQCGAGGGGEQKILVATGSGRRRAKTVGQASESSLQSQHSPSASGHHRQQLARSGSSSNQKRKQAFDCQQDNSRQQASVDGGRVSGAAAISVGGGKQVGTVYLSIDMPRSRGDSLVSLSNDKSTSVVVMAADELSQARELAAAPASPQPPSSCPGQEPALDVESEVAPKSVCKQLPPASVSQFSFASNQLLPGAGSSSSSCMAAPDYSPAAHNMQSPVTGPSATNKRLDSGARCDEDQGNMSNLAPMESEIATETNAPDSESAGKATAWPSGGAESSAPDDASRRRRININNQSGAGQCTGGAAVVTSASVHSIAQSNKYASPSPSCVGQQSSSTTTKIAKNNNSMQASMSEPETDIRPTTSACCQEIAQRAQIGSKWPHTTSQSDQQSSSENPNHHHHQQQHIKQSSSVRIELCKASPEPPDASSQMGPNESQAPQNRQNLSPSTSSSSSSASSSSASSRQSSSLSTTGASSSINSCLAHSGSFSSVSSRTTGSLCTCSSSSCQLNLGANASICSRAERVRANTTATTTTTTTQIEASSSSSSKPPFKPPTSIQVNNNNKGSSNGDNNSRRSGSQIQPVSRGASTEAAPRGALVAQRQHTPPRAMGRGLRTQRTASATAGSVAGQSHQLVAAAVRASARRHAQAVGVVGDGTAPMLATSCSGSLATLGGANNNGPPTIGKQLAHQQQRRRHQPGLSASMVLTKQKTSTSGNSSFGTRQSSRNDSSQTGLDTRDCSAMNLNDQSFETSNTCATTTCETASSCSMFTNTTSTTASRSSLCEEIDVAPEDQSTRADSFSGSDSDDDGSSARLPISVLDRDVEATMTTTTTGSGDEHDKESPTPPTVVSAGDDKQSSQSTGTTDSMDNTPPTASKLCDDERAKCVDVVGSTQVALVCNGTQQVHVEDSTTRKQAPRLSGNSTSTRL